MIGDLITATCLVVGCSLLVVAVWILAHATSAAWKEWK